MPFLQCASCGQPMEINAGEQGLYNRPNNACHPEKLIGSAICRKCKTGTGFEISNNVLGYVSGKSSYGSLHDNLSDKVKLLYGEAELCYQNGAPNASVAMCRAATELVLTETGFEGKNLFELITDAKKKSKLDEVEVGLAHSTRLITREAIHRSEFVSLADVPSILSATIKILNKLADPTSH